MRALALLAVLAVVALAFAGCSAKPKDTGKSTSSSTSHSTTGTSSSHSASASSSGTSSSATSSSSASAAPNHAPRGTLAVASNGTVATFHLAATDEDGDNLTWSLAFGDGKSSNGTQLPTNVTHTYAAVGNFSANYTVTDGKNPSTYNVTVALVAAGGGAPVVFTGMIVGPDPVAASTNGPAQDTECGFALFAMLFEPALLGKGYGDYFSFDGKVLDGYTVTVTPDGMLWQFLTGTAYDGDYDAATVPAAADGFLICSASAVNANYTVTLTP